MFRKILVPLDLHRELSWRRALPVAADQARLYGAEVTLLYVVPSAFAMAAEPHEDDARLARLRALAEEHFEHPEAVNARVEHHNAPERAILGIAADEQFDLVVMNSHAPGLRDQSLDAHATEVVRNAPCSVLVVR